MYKTEQEFTITIECKIDGYDKDDALKEYEHLIDPMIEELEEKLEDRFEVSIQATNTKVIDIEQDLIERKQDADYQAMKDDE